MKFSKDTYVNLPFVRYPFATSAIIQRYEEIARDTDKAEIFLDTDEIPLPDGSLFVPHRKSLDNESKVNIHAFKDIPSQILIGVDLEDGDLSRFISKFTQNELIEQTLENYRKIENIEGDETYPVFENFLDLSYEDIEKGNFNLQALIEDEATEPFCSVIYTPVKDNELKTELIIGIGDDGNGTELTWSVPLDLDDEIMLGNEMYRRIDVETFQNILDDDRINDGLFIKEYYIEGGKGWSSECDSYGEVFGNTLPSDNREALDMLNEAEFFFNDKCSEFLASKGIETDTERNWYNFSTQWGDDDQLMGKLRITDKESGEEHIKEIPFTDEEKCRFESILERYLEEELKAYQKEIWEKDPRIPPAKPAVRNICIINGKGGTGKDTLISSLTEGENAVKVFNVSSIDPIKDICEDINPTGKKDLAYRKLLSDMKGLIDKYYIEQTGDSYTNSYVLKEAEYYLRNCKDTPVMFVHIREPENIDRCVKSLNSLCSRLRLDTDEVRLSTLLVRSDREQKDYGNKSDDGVENYPYDYTYQSKGDIQQDGEMFKTVVNDYLLGEGVKYYDKPVIDNNNREVIVGETAESEVSCGVMFGNVNPYFTVCSGQLKVKLPKKIEEKADREIENETKPKNKDIQKDFKINSEYWDI